MFTAEHVSMIFVVFIGAFLQCRISTKNNLCYLDWMFFSVHDVQDLRIMKMLETQSWLPVRALHVRQSNWLMCHIFIDPIFVDKCRRVILIFWKLDYFHLFGFCFLLLKRCLHCWIGYYQITNPAVFKWCFYVSDRRLPQSWFWVCAQPMRDGVTIRYTCKPRISPVVKFVSQFQPNKQVRHL